MPKFSAELLNTHGKQNQKADNPKRGTYWRSGNWGAVGNDGVLVDASGAFLDLNEISAIHVHIYKERRKDGVCGHVKGEGKDANGNPIRHFFKTFNDANKYMRELGFSEEQITYFNQTVFPEFHPEPVAKTIDIAPAPLTVAEKQQKTIEYAHAQNTKLRTIPYYDDYVKYFDEDPTDENALLDFGQQVKSGLITRADIGNAGADNGNIDNDNNAP